MSGKRFALAGLAAAAVLMSAQAFAEPLVWGIQVEGNEYRLSEGPDVYAWDFDAFLGTDDFRGVWRSEGESSLGEGQPETLENQIRGQIPISTFWDLAGGVRFDSPAGPDRVLGVIGLHGLGEQFFEVDLDLFVSEDPALRLDVEYEGLITQRITATPVIEIDVPLTDDPEFALGRFAPEIELGPRVSYDLIDRAVSPYIGVVYERAFGETSRLRQAEGEDPGAVSFLVGARLQY